MCHLGLIKITKCVNNPNRALCNILSLRAKEFGKQVSRKSYCLLDRGL